MLKLDPVPFNQVKVTDRFWLPRMETNRTVTVPYSLDMLEKTASIHNLELAAQGAREGFVGPPWTDSDVYKALEAASYTLTAKKDPALDVRLDAIIAKVAAAQRPDGYLNSFYEVTAPDKRFTNLSLHHELYCAGHLFEAAVAHYQATGKRNLLDVAARYADYIDSVFGDAPGKRLGYCGHPEIELALVKLWRATGEKRYFDLASYFVEKRGSGFLATEPARGEWPLGPDYFQDDVPIREHTQIKGHAVRAAYLFSGVTDVLRETGDAGLARMLDRVWRNTAEKRAYITGGIGPSAGNEGFTEDYDLPNATAYQETCASVALAMWNQRLGLLYGDSRFIDMMETSLYNGVLAGVSLDGKRFFYDNVLATRGGKERSEWFGCACCPPNVSRTIASIGGYAYATSADSIWVNLYIGSEANVSVGGRQVKLTVKTDYPWDGRVRLTLAPSTPGAFGLRLRIPAWCSGASVRVNGGSKESLGTDGGYMNVRREWKAGDVVELDMPMTARQIEAHPSVKADRGLLALERGPIVYCLEAVDQKAPLDRIAIPRGAKLKAVKRADLLDGSVVLTGKGEIAADEDWSNRLYAPAVASQETTVTAIPYALWCNRGQGAMEVWVPTTPPPALTGPSISASFQGGLSDLQAVNDGSIPANSGVRTTELFHWWPNKSGTEWVQYDWRKPITTASSKVYWFDDTGVGECRLPQSWRLLYRDGESWKPVEIEGEYPIALNTWSEIRFKPVTTTALRLEVRLREGFSSGIHEWTVTE